MTWLTPWSGFWLLVVIVPPLLLLYVLRLRRARQVVPSTMLWVDAAEDLQANTPFQRLRRNLLLLLQLIVLALLALAIAQPRMESAAGRGEPSVLLVDRSASMRARDAGGDRSRFEAAIEAAREAVDRLHPGGWFTDAQGRTMIVALGSTADIVQPFTSSRAALLAALDRLEVGDSAAHLAPGVALARAHGASPDPDEPTVTEVPARIELFSDGGLDDIRDVVLQGETIEFHRVGSGDVLNTSVVSVVADRLPDDPDQVQVFATLVNWSANKVPVTVQLSIDGAAMHVEDLQLPGAEAIGEVRVAGRRDVVFSPVARPGEVLVEVRLIGDDALAIDDVAWAVARPPDPVRVLLVSPGRTLLKRALGVLPGIELVAVEPAPGDVPADVDLVVYDSLAPGGPTDDGGAGVAAAFESLPGVPTLSFDTPLPTRHVTWFGHGGPQSLLTSDARHGVVHSGVPGDLWVQRGQRLQGDSLVDVLVEGTGGPLVLAWDEAGARRVHVAFDPAASTWPWDPSFVTFLVDAIDWLTRRGIGGAAAVVVVGESVSEAVPASAQQVTTVSPGGTVRTWSPGGSGRAAWGPIEESGPWVLRWDGPRGGQRLISVGIQAEREGDLYVPETLTIAGRDVQRLDAALAGSIPLWPWAVLASLLVLALEWAVYCRRIG